MVEFLDSVVSRNVSVIIEWDLRPMVLCIRNALACIECRSIYEHTYWQWMPMLRLVSRRDDLCVCGVILYAQGWSRVYFKVLNCGNGQFASYGHKRHACPFCGNTTFRFAASAVWDLLFWLSDAGTRSTVSCLRIWTSLLSWSWMSIRHAQNLDIGPMSLNLMFTVI